MRRKLAALMATVAMIAIGLLSCHRNQNPVEPQARLKNRSISGKVLLENQTDHYGIFVYLDSLKLRTLTDKEGNYTLTIPDSLISNHGLAIQSRFHIYYSFYLYDFDSSTVITNRDGFVCGKEDLDIQGHVRSVELKRFMDLKSITDKSFYKPEDTLWAQLTLTNLSDYKIEVVFYWQGSGYPICETTLFDSSSLWYFLASSTFAEHGIKLEPGQSLERSSRYPLISIEEPQWGISLPWQCYVKPAGFYVLPRTRPRALKGIVAELGWPYGRYLPEFIQNVGYFIFLINKFHLAQITINP